MGPPHPPSPATVAPSSAGSGRARRDCKFLARRSARRARPPSFVLLFLSGHAGPRRGPELRPRGPGRALWENARRCSRHWGRCTHPPPERGNGASLLRNPLPSRRRRETGAMCCARSLWGTQCSDGCPRCAARVGGTSRAAAALALHAGVIGTRQLHSRKGQGSRGLVAFV